VDRRKGRRDRAVDTHHLSPGARVAVVAFELLPLLPEMWEVQIVRQMACKHEDRPAEQRFVRGQNEKKL
jgi:hypothetical protein